MTVLARRSGWLAVLLAGLFSAAVLVAPGTARADDEEKMIDAMDAINTAYKKIKKQVADPAQNKASAKLAAEMQKHAFDAKVLVPTRQAKEANKEQFNAAYVKSMNTLLIELVNLENAFIDGKNADADKILTKINEMKKSEHEKFQVTE